MRQTGLVQKSLHGKAKACYHKAAACGKGSQRQGACNEAVQNPAADNLDDSAAQDGVPASI